MNGTVYVFNATPQLIILTVNNQAGKLRIPGYNATANFPYTPFSTQAARSDPNLGGLFINGQSNSLSIATEGAQRNGDVDIPPDVTGGTALWLYIFLECVMLFDTTGKVLHEEPVTQPPEMKILIEAEVHEEELPDQELCG
jgi:hypothetical protein